MAARDHHEQPKINMRISANRILLACVVYCVCSSIYYDSAGDGKSTVVSEFAVLPLGDTIIAKSTDQSVIEKKDLTPDSIIVDREPTNKLQEEASASAATKSFWQPFAVLSDEARRKNQHNRKRMPTTSYNISLQTYGYSVADLSTNMTLFDSIFNNSDAPKTSTIAWPNVTTAAFYDSGLRSGFRNQMMVFTILILDTVQKGYGQFLLDSVLMKDTYGTNRNVHFAGIWDVEHWNSFYPQLPRLVDADPILHDQWNNNNWRRLKNITTTAAGEEVTSVRFTNVDNSYVTEKPDHPKGFGKRSPLFLTYIRYAQGKGPYTINGRRHPAEILMLTSALRPSPFIQSMIDEKLQALATEVQEESINYNTTSTPPKDTIVYNNNNASNAIEYITLHARVEPDMQKHPLCRWMKVLNLTEVFRFMETKWPDPPAPRIFMPINRDLLEQEGAPDVWKKQLHQKKEVNWIAVENLKALNDARDYGLWGGRVKVFELGSNVFKETKFDRRRQIAGAALNFFVSVNAKIFIGTEVSSYSHDLLATRFYRGLMENYKYLPDGLHDWTPPGLEDPPGFGC